MKVFLSWSGEKSKAVAELTNEWLQCVLQSLRPWISTKGIDGGSLWFTEISNELNETAIGIVFLTQENKDSPWIMFESGALAKGLSSNRVCTYLIDLKPQDINNPLANFNHTFPTKDSILRLIYMLNNMLGDSGLETNVLEKVFEKYWPDYEASLAGIEENYNTPPSEKEERQPDDILGEILLTTRSLSNRLAKIERQEDLKKYTEKYNKDFDPYSSNEYEDFLNTNKSKEKSARYEVRKLRDGKIKIYDHKTTPPTIHVRHYGLEDEQDGDDENT